MDMDITAMHYGALNSHLYSHLETKWPQLSPV